MTAGDRLAADASPSAAPQTLFKEAPVDTGLFNLYLHQNYPVFCSDIDECADSIEVLSRSDALKTDDDLVRLPRFFGSRRRLLTPLRADSQWQSSPVAIAYAFNTTVRGLLASLPSPMPQCAWSSSFASARWTH